MKAISLARNYIRLETSLYREAAEKSPRVAKRRFPTGRQRIWLRRTARLSKWLDESGVEVPAKIMSPYALGVLDRCRARIPLKYQYRALNGLRELARTHVLFPELLSDGEPVEIIDLSAGGCGTADVLGQYGHKVEICDYFDANKINPMGHSYAELHKFLGLNCRFFDGRSLPYEFADESRDIVLVYQAIDAYGPVAMWYDIVDELLRIARRSVGLVLNPAIPKTPENEAQVVAFIGDMKRDYGATVSTCPETSLPALRIDK
ncbi:hypothetical protein [Roseovarius ramblicola]|uniref:Class I SAM-dependent methyltransferase n=1 Tax=Roseovarius ramblicola TaxID=2022336 RepID=A0ABV5HZM0_9RHOB